MAEWISVEDELPINRNDVWIVVDGCVALGNYADWLGGWVRYDEQGDPYSFQNVTHWQGCRKPEPPNAELTGA